MSRQKKKRSPKVEPSIQSGWKAWYQTKAPVFRFCAKFGALMALLYIFLATSYGDQVLYRYLEINACASNAILHGLGQHTQLSGLTIHSPTFAVTVERGCDAVEPTWLICAAMLSVQSSWSHRLLGMLIGVVVLQTLNLVRIVSLYVVGAHWPRIFNTAHLEIWPVVFVVLAIALFIYWREWTYSRQETHAVV